MGNQATRIVISDKGTTVCETCGIADRALARMRGLLGRPSLPPGEGLLITPACSIHTWFMRFPLDVVFLSRDLEVLDVVASVGPWRTVGRRSARVVLELSAGEGSRRGLSAGDRLSLVAPGSIRTPVVFVRAGSESAS
jgi:uncharacterized membrane protein (UPF0127 family)